MKSNFFNFFIIFLSPFLCHANCTDSANSIEKYRKETNDTLRSSSMITGSFWTQWGPFSTISEFAEIKFNEDNTFHLLRGKVNHNSTPNDSTIYESYSGIWTVKDSIVTLSPISSKSYLNHEQTLRIIGNNKLEITSQFGVIGSHSDYFIRKPMM